MSTRRFLTGAVLFLHQMSNIGENMEKKRRGHIGIRSTPSLEEALETLIKRMERVERRPISTTEAVERAIRFMERETRAKEQR